MVVFGRDEGGFATVAGIGVEDNLSKPWSAMDSLNSNI